MPPQKQRIWNFVCNRGVCAAAAATIVQEAGRPIRYPAKIPPTLQELSANVDGIMSGLRQMLQEHLAGVTKRLRVQVRARLLRANTRCAGRIHINTCVWLTDSLVGMPRLVQVVQAYRLLERMPAAAVSLLVQHMLQLLADQRQQLRSSYVSQRQQLERQLEQHKHGLHPSMLSLARWAWTQHMSAAA